MSTRKRILIIEDTYQLREMEARLLREDGHEVLEAANGTEGLAILRKITPDLIVLDAMLPGKTGFDICRELKNDPLYARIPILITTSITEGTGQDDEVWRDRTGADDFMSKPFSTESFLARTRRLLE
ncbi:MAG: response regulator [Lentisphaerales bacterium]|jgi:DNA-binding response OmpR family regulator|nr:MAG: response regulator [Lentisphaerales bacterium]